MLASVVGTVVVVKSTVDRVIIGGSGGNMVDVVTAVVSGNGACVFKVGSDGGSGSKVVVESVAASACVVVRLPGRDLPVAVVSTAVPTTVVASVAMSATVVLVLRPGPGLR